MKTNLKTCTYFCGDIALYEVEVMVTQGIGIHLMGLPDVQCKESLLRVVTALQSLGYRIPGKKIVIRINEAITLRVEDGLRFPETSSAFDLPIALGILMSSEQMPLIPKGRDICFFGELKLDGALCLPYCGHDASCTGTGKAVIETLDWQLRNTFDRIVTPEFSGGCSEVSSGHNIGVMTLAEIIEAITAGL